MRDGKHKRPPVYIPVSHRDMIGLYIQNHDVVQNLSLRSHHASEFDENVHT